MATLTNTARRGLRGLVGLVTDPFGRRQAHLTRVVTHERAVWLHRVLIEHAEATHKLVVEQAERTRTAVAGGDEWKVLELETLLRFLRKRDYLAAIKSSELDVPVIQTEHPLASDSNDTLHPRGAKNDNSICLRFNQRLYQLFNRRAGLKVLDLGCAGGGLVRTLIDDGHFAVGLEGSDYPLLNQSGEWGTIPQHLLTCDITKPFTLTSCVTSEPLKFDAITAWEVMEHIPEDRIEALMTNVERHLAPGGWVLFSIATFMDHSPTTGVEWHRTVQPRAWWEAKFAELGFVPSNDHPFGPHDWLRGSGNGRYDWRPEDGMGFHIAASRERGASMTNVVQWCLARANMRLMRLSSYRKVMRDVHRPAPAPREAVTETEADEEFVREVTQCEPIAIPRVPGSFFIKVKVDYPGVFRPNPPEYVYKPVADLFDRHRVAIDRNAKLLAPHMYCDELDSLPGAKVNDTDPHWNNGMFERDDARAVYAMTAHLRPRRILEVGSGNSTKFFRKAITDHRINCELVCIDPQPRAEIRTVADHIISQHVKDVDTRHFESLRDGDILFWDGSHIAFNGTDTTHLYLSLLPLIKRNVYVHIHDIQLPHEYEAGYSAHYYNEQYLLATLLLNSSEWLPVLPVFWLHARGKLRHGGASFWMARRHLD